MTNPTIKQRFFLLFAIAAMAAFAIVREVIFFPLPDLIPNPDSAWLILAAKRWLDGQKLYVDIMETNPPLIIWLSAIPVWLARIINGSAFTVAALLVTLLNLVSLWLCAAIIHGIIYSQKLEQKENQNFLGRNFAFVAIVLYITCGFFLFTPAIYGQREALFVTLVLPYLILSLRGGVADVAIQTINKDGIASPSTRNGTIINILIIAMAALGCAIKPFFILIWGINELYIALEKRSFRSLFAWHNWVIGCVQLAYFTAIYIFTPEYITDIFPALRVTYFTFNAPWENILEPIFITSSIVFLIVVLAKIRGGYVQIISRLLLWFLACAGLMLIQRKDWINHFYPMFFMAGLIITFVLTYLYQEWCKLRLDIGRRKFISMCLAFFLLVGAIYADGVFSYKMFAKPSKVSKALLIEINSKAAGKYVYPLVYNIQPSFPVISLSQGVFRGGFHQLWPLVGLILLDQQGDVTPKFLRVKKWFYDAIVRDFTNYPPELVWVDENVNVNVENISEYAIAPANRDIIAVLSRDARFADIWQHYEKYNEIEDELDEDEVSSVKKDEELSKPIKKPEKYTLYLRKK